MHSQKRFSRFFCDANVPIANGHTIADDHIQILVDKSSKCNIPLPEAHYTLDKTDRLT